MTSHLHSSVRSPVAGFTMMEMMIVGVMLAIAASIALPSYASHVKRSRILDGLARLSDHQARMEQFFLDRRTYADVSGNCGLLPPVAGPGGRIRVVVHGHRVVLRLHGERHRGERHERLRLYDR